MSEVFSAFKARVEREDGDPEAVVALFIEALVTLESDESTACEMIALLCSEDQRSEASGTPSGYRLNPLAREGIRRLVHQRNIARSYAGADYRQGYGNFDADNLVIELDRQYSAARQGVDYPAPGQAKLFVACGGASSPRPVTLVRDQHGHWRVHEWSSLTLGVRKPTGS